MFRTFFNVHSEYQSWTKFMPFSCYIDTHQIGNEDKYQHLKFSIGVYTLSLPTMHPLVWANPCSVLCSVLHLQQPLSPNKRALVSVVSYRYLVKHAGLPLVLKFYTYWHTFASNANNVTESSVKFPQKAHLFWNLSVLTLMSYRTPTLYGSGGTVSILARYKTVVQSTDTCWGRVGLRYHCVITSGSEGHRI